MQIGLFEKLILLTFFLGFHSFIIPVFGQQAVGLHFAAGKSFSIAPLKAASEQAYYSLAPGFDYQYSFSDKLAFFGGVGMLSTGKHTINDDLRWGSEHDGMGNYVRDPSLPHKIDSRVFQLFLAIQAGIKYYVTNNRVRIFIQPYLEEDIFLSNRNTTLSYLDNGDLHSKTSTSEPITPHRKLVISAGLGIGAEIDLSNRFSLYLIADGKLMTSEVASPVKAVSIIPALKLGVWYKI